MAKQNFDKNDVFHGLFSNDENDLVVVTKVEGDEATYSHYGVLDAEEKNIQISQILKSWSYKAHVHFKE
jgi:hypothetical protein